MNLPEKPREAPIAPRSSGSVHITEAHDVNAIRSLVTPEFRGEVFSWTRSEPGDTAVDESYREEVVYLLIWQDLGRVNLRTFNRGQVGLRTVLTASVRVSIIPFADYLPPYGIFTPLWNPLEERLTGGPLHIRASAYANPVWDVIQTILPWAAVSGALVAGLRNAERLMNIVARLSTFREEVTSRRKKLRAEAANSDLEELKALAEQAELGREVRIALMEGRDVGGELSRLDEMDRTKQVASGIAADTLFNAVADVPTEIVGSQPRLRAITAEVARQGIEAAQELMAKQRMSPEAISTAGEEGAHDGDQT